MNINAVLMYGKAAGSQVSARENKEQQVGSFTKAAVDGIGDAVRVTSGEGRKASGISYLDELEELGNGAELEQAQAEKAQGLVLLEGEDYESIEEEEGSLEKSCEEAIARSVERNRANRQMNLEQLEKNKELRLELREGLEKLQQLGFLSQKSEAQLRQVLEEAGIPATEESISQVIAALGMGSSALQVTDQSKNYIIGQNLPATIENLYQGKYSGNSSVDREAGSNAGVSEAADSGMEFEKYRQQVGQILEGCGKADEEGWKAAEWLFGQELPVNEETINKSQFLDSLAADMTADKLLEQILFAMAEGYAPKDAVLDGDLFDRAGEAVKGFGQVPDAAVAAAAEDILKEMESRQAAEGAKLSEEDAAAEEPQMPAADTAGQLVQEAEKGQQPGNGQDGSMSGGSAGQENGQADASRVQEVVQAVQKAEESLEAGLGFLLEAGRGAQEREVPAFYTFDMAELDIVAVTVKRQLEEVRQKMTVQAAVSMERRGIHVETEPLNRLVEELRRMENAYYSAQVTGDAAGIEEEELGLFQETLSKAADIAHSHASLLGVGVRRQALLTVNELHGAIGSPNWNRHTWNGTYEAVSTQVRSDLGDSIQKAFAGIPDMLADMGLESTEANNRAVRILGYNSIEITKENIDQIKLLDYQVNRVIDNMKPTTVLELIHRGDNPLDMPIDELCRELEEINREKDISSEERYSRFLWQLEKSGDISEQERAGYIGVYRLLHQIERTDGAVIGAVMEAGQELTLGNLLTQARTLKKGRMDATVDDSTGMTEVHRSKASITEQIDTGFSQSEYYMGQAQEALEEITPAKLKEITDGNLEALLETSVEAFVENLKQAEGNTSLKAEYFEQQASRLKEELKDSDEAKELLSSLQIEPAIENVVAAKHMLEGRVQPYRQFYNRKTGDGEKKEEEEALLDGFDEALESEEELNSQCEKAEIFIQDILRKSAHRSDITFEDLQHLRQLGQGFRLQGMLRERRSYEIPIRTGKSITSLHLTIVRGEEESGRIQISMEDQEFGRMAMRFRFTGDALTGQISCDERQGYEALRAQEEALKERLSYAGYPVKSISYGMDFRSGNELLKQCTPEKEDTGALYQIAKILVRSAAAAVQGQQQAES